MKLLVSAVGHSNVGLRRENNEDNFFISNVTVDSANDKTATLSSCNNSVVVLCDGMGGEEAGEIASQIAVKEIQKYNDDIIENFDEIAINHAIFNANESVCSKMYELKKCIGTTLVLFAFKDNDAILANVGDSRAYLFDGEKLEQLTIDDTEAQRLVDEGVLSASEAMKRPEKHKLTQNIGIPSDEMLIEPHIVHFSPKANERILMCSDGLTDMVSESEIEVIMSKKQTPISCVDELVQTALDNGGKDNVTVIVIDFEKSSILRRLIKS